MKLCTATAFEKGQIPPAPGDCRPFFPCFRIIAEAVAEVLSVVPAYLGSPSHKIGAFVVFTQEQVMIPSAFGVGFPDRQGHPAMGAEFFLIRHFDRPPESYL